MQLDSYYFEISKFRNGTRIYDTRRGLFALLQKGEPMDPQTAHLEVRQLVEQPCPGRHQIRFARAPHGGRNIPRAFLAIARVTEIIFLARVTRPCLSRLPLLASPAALSPLFIWRRGGGASNPGGDMREAARAEQVEVEGVDGVDQSELRQARQARPPGFPGCGRGRQQRGGAHLQRNPAVHAALT
eukprot:1179316-Prorocentrum_minimum.AAC.4